MVRALIVPVEGPVEAKEIEGDLNSVKRIVGGWIEIVSGPGRWHLYCNEEGKIMGLAPNYRANDLAQALGAYLNPFDLIVGDVVFLGDGPEGQEADVPQAVLAMAAAYGILPEEP